MANSSEVLPTEILPWQRAPWEQLWNAKQQQRLAHALLLVGIDGIGKSQFAYAFAAAILCSQPGDTGVRCGTCHSCCMINAKMHPDLVIIEPEEAGKKIGVDQIRSIIKNVNETTLKGGFRVIVINPATAMNVNAANALLKTLEEPAPNTLLILVSNQSLRLPATILSRCQKVNFSRPTSDEALHWLNQQMTDAKVDPQLLLKLADGAPLKALVMLENDLLSLRHELYQGFHSLSAGQGNPIQMAAKWQDADHLSVVDLLLSWLTDLLRFKLTQNHADLVNADYKNEITRISISLLQNNVLAYMDHLQQTRADLLSSVNLNKQLLLEDLFIRWAQYVPR
jgi:DNA polymerase-3 subunit delta'